MPKPPPTSSATTRIDLGSTPSAPASASRALDGICVESRIVSRPSRGFGDAGARLHRRGGEALVDEIERRRHARALANAASVAAASPWRIRAAMLPVACGPDLRRALGRRRRRADHRRQRLVFDLDQVDRVAWPPPAFRRPPPRPPRRRSARLRPPAPGAAATAPGEPSGRWNIGASGDRLDARRREFRAGVDGDHARAPRAPRSRRSRRCGHGRAASAGSADARAPAGAKSSAKRPTPLKQALVLDALHFAAAAEARRHRHSRHAMLPGRDRPASGGCGVAEAQTQAPLKRARPAPSIARGRRWSWRWSRADSPTSPAGASRPR